MKRIFIVLLILILSGCAHEVTYDLSYRTNEDIVDIIFTPLEPVQEEEDVQEYLQGGECAQKESLPYNLSSFLGDTPLEFIEYIYSNQIDIDMRRDGELLFTTGEINEWAAKYHAIWENEMNIVYGNLLAQLDGETRASLENSQASWEAMNQYNWRLWHDVLILSVGHGTGHASMIHLQSMERVRSRTFLLAEYYYWLTGDFAFSYGS